MNKIDAYVSDITGKVYTTKDECENEEKRYNDLQFILDFKNNRHFTFSIVNIGDNSNIEYEQHDAYYITSKEELTNLVHDLVYYDYIRVSDKYNYEYINDALYYTETHSWVYFIVYTNYDGISTVVSKNLTEYQEALLDAYKLNEEKFKLK